MCRVLGGYFFGPPCSHCLVSYNWNMTWLSNVLVTASGSRVRLPAGALLGTGSLGQLSLPSLRVGKSSTRLLARVKAGCVFTCVGWQVTLCDPIWQMTPCSSRTSSHRGLYSVLTFNFNCGRLKVKTVKELIAVNGTPSHSYGTSYGITQCYLPPDTMNAPRLTPASKLEHYNVLTLTYLLTYLLCVSVCAVTGLVVAGELLSCLKRTVSRTLFILASLHLHIATLVISLSVFAPSPCHIVTDFDTFWPTT